MKVLLLGPASDEISAVLTSSGDEVVRTEEPLRVDEDTKGAEFLVSFGYRHLLRRHVLDTFPGRVINLHISLLPWNRGADPNLWSFLEDSPKGVSIHVVDEGLDTGPILAQQEVTPSPDDTLASSYERLIDRIVQLFRASWIDIRDGRMVPRPQRGTGSFHSALDRKAFAHLLVHGWQTPVSQLVGKAMTSGGKTCRVT